MITAWRDVQKTPSDVKTVTLDWTDLLPEGTAAELIATHNAWTEPGELGADQFGDSVPAGLSGVVAADIGMTGLKQAVQLSGGSYDGYSLIAANVTLTDGTDLTRCFIVIVR